LKILYFGWDYNGLARQELNKQTIAEKVIESFEKCRMLEDASTCSLAVCGRTDKGVSALSQVLTLILRSNVHSGIGVIAPEDKSMLYPEKPEIDYVLVGNRNLPADIRILAWAPVPPEFTARRSCLSRSYKYFFPASGLNLQAIRSAAKKFEGAHDFRNFCSSQVSNGVVNHERRILSVELNVHDSSLPEGHPRQMCCLTFRGTAFLYHQIRCMVSILLSIGRGLEQPALIDSLLDIAKTPRKPQYEIAARMLPPFYFYELIFLAEPLVFCEPEYEGLEWQTSSAAREEIVKHIQRMWTEQAVRTTVVTHMLDRIEQDLFPECQQNNYLWPVCHEAPVTPSRNRQPILKRSTEESLEEKIKNYENKKSRKEALLVKGDTDDQSLINESEYNSPFPQ
uniref:tRNA pseudouridine synthase n=1 Tax=Schistocephalus solidus TaxID=70667 RepID=A0A183T4C7_SCHSO